MSRSTRSSLESILRNVFPAPASPPACFEVPAESRRKLGRTFTDADDFEGNTAAIISHGFWRRHFALDPSVIGRKVVLDREARTIIGVMPESFVFPMRGPDANISQPSFTFPWLYSPRTARPRTCGTKSVIGRLKSGISPDMANAEAATLVDRVAER